MLIRNHHQMAGAVGIQIQNDEVLARPMHHQILIVALGGSGQAEYASATSLLFLNVLVAPRTPQVVHKLGNTLTKCATFLRRRRDLRARLHRPMRSCLPDLLVPCSALSRGCVWRALPLECLFWDCVPRAVAVVWCENCRTRGFRSYLPRAETLRCCRRWLPRLLQNPYGSFPQPGRLPRSTQPSSCVLSLPFRSGFYRPSPFTLMFITSSIVMVAAAAWR